MRIQVSGECDVGSSSEEVAGWRLKLEPRAFSPLSTHSTLHTHQAPRTTFRSALSALRSPLTTHHSQFTTRHSQFTSQHSVLRTCCPLLTAHHLLPTFHHLHRVARAGPLSNWSSVIYSLTHPIEASAARDVRLWSTATNRCDTA